MKIRTRAACALVVALAASAGIGAETVPCDDKAHQFDFWIGEWEVTLRGDGKLVGHNSIAPILGGCVLQETWSGSSGSAGSSFNFYDPQRKRWRQLWVWREGTTLELEGTFASGRMVLEGESIEGNGTRVSNRITWFDNDDDTVRQLWEISRDGGKTWAAEFDGLYRKKG